MIIQYLPFLFLLVQNQNPTYLVPTNMVSGQVFLSDPGPLTHGIYDYSVSFNETIDNVQVCWGLAHINIDWSGNTIRIQNQLDSITSTGFKIQSLFAQVSLYRTYVLFIAFEQATYFKTSFQIIDTFQIQNGFSDTEEHNFTMQMNPLFNAQCFVFLNGFEANSTKKLFQIQVACQAIPQQNKIVINIISGNETDFRQVQINFGFLDLNYYLYLTDYVLDYGKIQNNSLSITNQECFVFGFSQFYFTSSPTQLSLWQQIGSFSLSSNSSALSYYAVSMVLADCDKFYNRMDGQCYDNDFGCPQEGSWIKTETVDQGRVMNQEKIWAQINGELYELEMDNIEQNTSWLQIKIETNETIEIQNINLLSNKFLIYKNFLHQQNNSTFIQMNETNESLWAMVDNYIIGIDDNVTVYTTIEYFEPMCSQSLTILLSNMTNITKTQVKHFRISKYSENAIQFIIIVQEFIVVFKIQISSTECTIEQSSKTSVNQNFTKIYSNKQTIYEQQYIAFFQNHQIHIYREEDTGYELFDTLVTPDEYFSLEDNPKITFSHDAQYLFIFDSLLLQILKREEDQYRFQNIIEFSSDIDSLLLNTLKGLFIIQGTEISVYGCQWELPPIIEPPSNQNNTTQQQEEKGVSITTQITVFIVLASITSIIVVGLLIYKLSPKPEAVQVSPQNPTKKSFNTDGRDLGRKHNLQQSLQEFKNDEIRRQSTSDSRKQLTGKMLIIEEIN